MKKSLSILLSAAVAFGSLSSVAFAADETTQQKFDALKAKGIFTGINAAGDAGLAMNMNRAQFARVAALILGLPGIGSPDSLTVSEKPFSDVSLGVWYTEEVAAVKAAGLMVGNANGTFNPTGNISVQELAVVTAKLLGLTPVAGATVSGAASWAGPSIQAIMDAGVAFPTNYTQAATRGQLVDISFIAEAVLAAPKVVSAKANSATEVEVVFSDSTTAQKFTVAALTPNVEQTRTVTYKGKTYDVKVTLAVAKPDLASAVAKTNKSVEVTLNADVNAAVASDFTITDASGNALAVTAATLKGSKTIWLTTAAQTTGAKYTLTANGKSVVFVGAVVDTTKLTATTVVPVSNKMIRVVFDNTDASEETILNAVNYTFDNGLTASSVAYVPDKKDEVYVTTSAQTAGTVYKLTVQNVADLSGNVMDKKELTFAGVAADTTAPNPLSATSLKGNTVTLIIADSSQLDESTVTNTANYTVNNGLTISKIEVVENKVGVTNKTIKITTSNQTSGTVYDLKINAVADVFGNKVDNKTLQFAGTPLDTTPPSISVATPVSNTKVAVVFNDELDEATVAAANFTFDNGLTVVGVALDKADATDTVNYKKRVYLTTSAQTAGTVYKVTVTGVKDSSGNTITTSQTYQYQFSGKAADTTKPTVTSVAALNGNKVQIVFADTSDLDEASVKLLTNYSFNNSLGYPVSVASWTAGTKTLVLNTAQQTNGTIYEVTINGIKDASGNTIEETKKTFAGIGNSLDALSLSSVVALNNQQIQVKFNKDITAGTVTNVDFSLAKGSAAAVTLDSDLDSGTAGVQAADVDVIDATTVIITLPAGAKLQSDVYTLKVVGDVRDAGNVALVTTNNDRALRTFGGLTDDAVAASITAVSQILPNVIEVHFSSPVTIGGNLTATTDVEVTGTGLTTRNAASTSSYELSSDKKSVQIVLDGNLEANKVASLKIANGWRALITDATGNFALKADASQTYATKAFGTTDVAASALKIDSAVSIDEQTIELTFNQAVKFTDLSNITDANFATLSKVVNGTATALVAGTDYDITAAKKTASNKVRVYFKNLTAGDELVEGSIYRISIVDGAGGDALFTTLANVALDVGAEAARGQGTFGYNATTNAAPKIAGVSGLSDKVVKVTLSEKVVNLVAADITLRAGDTVIDAADYTVTIGAGAVDSFTITYDAATFAAGTSYSVEIVDAAGSNLTDETLVDAFSTVAGDKKVTFGGTAS